MQACKFKRIFFPLCLRERLKQNLSFVFVTLLAKTRLKSIRFLAQENTIGRKWTHLRSSTNDLFTGYFGHGQNRLTACM